MKYIDKIFELMGSMIQGAGLGTKRIFATITDWCLLKIVKAGLNKKSLSE